MTTKSLDEMIAVMQAARDGKRIECLYLRRSDSEWIHVQAHPLWNWEMFDYRVKPEPKLRPWKPEEVPVGALYKFGDHISIIISATSTRLFFCDSGGVIAWNYFDAGCLSEKSSYSLDGGKTWKPCGVEE